MAFEQDTIGACTYIKSFIVPQADILQQIHIVANVQSITPESNAFYINGKNYTLDGYGWAEGQSNVPADIIAYLASASQAPTNNTTAGTQTYDVYLGSLNNTYYVPFLASDFRYYGDAELIENCSNNNPCDEGYQCIDGVCSARTRAITPEPGDIICSEEPDSCPPDMTCVDGVCIYTQDINDLYVPAYAAKIYYGYILGGELVAVSFTRMDGSKFPNETNVLGDNYFKMAATQQGDPCDDCVGNDFECQDGECVYVGDHRNIASDNVITYGPLVNLKAFSIEGYGYDVQIYYSKLISAGRSIEQVPYVLLGTYCACGFSSDLSQKMLELTGNFPNDGTYAFKAVLLDGTTGVVYDTQLPIKKPLKNVSKFKAGAELSGKVN
jgi:hypothetical protein